MKNRMSKTKSVKSENSVLDTRKKRANRRLKKEGVALVDQKGKKPKNKGKSKEEKDAYFNDNEQKDTVRVRKKPNMLVALRARVGASTIMVRGENSQRAIGAVMKICRVDGVKTSQDGCTFVVKSKHLGKIIALLDNLCYDYKIIDNRGIAPYALSVAMRPGLLVGLMIALSAIIVLSQFVTRVSVSGAGANLPAALKNEICAILDQSGVKVGAKTCDVNEKAVQDKILALDGVAFASVKKKGSAVSVVVKQALPQDFSFVTDGERVKATKRAVVTRVVVTGGTAVKKYGDVVSPGDVLIDGYVEYGDDKIPVKASGYAFGKVYHTLSVFFANESVRCVRKDTKTLVRYAMFGKTPKLPQSPFEKYELKTSVQEFGFLLPIRIYRFEYTAIEEIKERNDKSVDEMKKIAFSRLCGELKESVKVLDVYYDVQKGDNGVSVTVTLEAEERI